MTECLLAARALVVHDLAARGMDTAHNVSIVDEVLSARRWWVEQWPDGQAYVACLVAQDVQEALLETVGRWPLCSLHEDGDDPHELRVTPDLGPDPQWMCEEDGCVVAPVGARTPDLLRATLCDRGGRTAGLWTTPRSATRRRLSSVSGNDSPVDQEAPMTAFRVTPAELLELSRQVHGTAGSIEAELGGLRGRVAPIGASWNGQAQERFQVLYEEWNRSAQGLQQALAGISQLLNQAGLSYDDAERRIAGSFAGR